MITRNQAIHLLKEYSESLKALQTKIEASVPQDQTIPTILAALTVIATGEKNPDDQTDPQALVEKYLVSLHGRKCFKDLYELHLKDDAILCAQLKNFHDAILKEKEQIVIYKAKNKKLAVTFPDVMWRNTFIKELGGYQFFPANHRYYSKQSSPHILKQNPTTLYIHSYETPTTHDLAAEFPNKTMRTAFLTLLQHNPHDNMGIDPVKTPIYFQNNALLAYGSNFKVPAPMVLVNDVYAGAKRQIERATIFIKNAPLFFSLPSELNNKIAAKTTDAVSIPEDEREAIAESYFKPQLKK